MRGMIPVCFMTMDAIARPHAPEWPMRNQADFDAPMGSYVSEFSRAIREFAPPARAYA